MASSEKTQETPNAEKSPKILSKSTSTVTSNQFDNNLEIEFDDWFDDF